MIHCDFFRLETDILFGNKNGAKTLLVLTGNATTDILQTTMEDSDNRNCVPDFVLDSVGDLLKPAKELELKTK